MKSLQFDKLSVIKHSISLNRNLTTGQTLNSTDAVNIKIPEKAVGADGTCAQYEALDEISSNGTNSSNINMNECSAYVSTATT